MKLCPRCQANVEGLIHHCDCCGALLNNKKHLFFLGIYSLPQCLLLSELTNIFFDEIEPENASQYSSFLDKIDFMLICYPDSMNKAFNKKNHVRYSSKLKKGYITMLIPFNDFIYANKDVKSILITDAILNGLNMLQHRLLKHKLNIDEYVADCEKKLNLCRMRLKKIKYIF